MLELNGLTMKHGIELSKRCINRLTAKQQQEVLDIMGGKPYFVKDKILWIFTDFNLGGYPISPWYGKGELSKESEKILLKMCKKLSKVLKTK